MTGVESLLPAFFVGAGVSYNSGCPVFSEFWRAYFATVAGENLTDTPGERPNPYHRHSCCRSD